MAHSTSSFTVSMVCSGIGDARIGDALLASPSEDVRGGSEDGADDEGREPLRQENRRTAGSPPPSTPLRRGARRRLLPPIIPKPGAAVRPFCAISAFASSTSCRTRGERSRVRSRATSPSDSSRRPNELSDGVDITCLPAGGGGAWSAARRDAFTIRDAASPRDEADAREKPGHRRAKRSASLRSSFPSTRSRYCPNCSTRSAAASVIPAA